MKCKGDLTVAFFNPEIFLSIAKKILKYKDIDEQGKFRTVIGRAYYAAFLAVREYLIRYRGRTFDKERQHQDVIDALDTLDAYNVKYLLERLRDNRVNADYYLYKMLTLSLCKKSISISEEIINSIEDI
ncbi:MAG: HEPN domain-containing protein [Candidatus Thorarchaeota archaeon]